MNITEKELVMFGNYLLGKKRKELFKKFTMKGYQSLPERLGAVHDSDLSVLRGEIMKGRK